MSEGEGARAERARKRRSLVIAVLTVIGALMIAAMLTFARISTGTPLGHLPPAAAIAGALLFPLVTLVGNWATWRASDELDRIDTLKANMIAFHFFLFAAWGWIVLAMGGLVPPPSILLLFISSGIAFLVTYYLLKLRR